ncbi:unnamed protein product [Rotaria sp. Silwood1]|nr:unnamed protein product [Rotaria sp. Silwood1]CAF1286566.1 unnamed protein product [Rotaria sp. Silwood1]CAF1291065.1 unnamed protein product [Rotaria sp. Silwood1]CAF3464250.1 unnamed protein product [Rotaria sp. Silwood1]CAF3511726.1 unnamed protein product [Rotaria sp. Silwood1]
MFVWWLIGSIGYLCIGIIYCEDPSNSLADIEPPIEDAKVGLSIVDSPPEQVNNETNNLAANDGVNMEASTTATPAPEQFSCQECTNCHLAKSEVVRRVCEIDINMCYKIYKRINNVTRLTRRGCSTSKGQCTVPVDDQSNSFDSITCCTSNKCNQAAQVKISFFLSSLSLFSLFIIINNT